MIAPVIALAVAAAAFWCVSEAADLMARRLIGKGWRPGLDIGELFREAAPLFRLSRVSEVIGFLLLAAAAGILLFLLFAPAGAP